MFDGSIEFRVAELGLIFLSPVPVYTKFHEAFAVLDTKRKNTLSQENLLVMFKTITRVLSFCVVSFFPPCNYNDLVSLKIIENHRYRYKIAMSDRSLVADVAV